MARLDVYRLPGLGAGHIVGAQADLFDFLARRAVVPVVEAASARLPSQDLHPIFDLLGVAHIMATHHIAAVPLRNLKRLMASLISNHDTITQILDQLL